MQGCNSKTGSKPDLQKSGFFFYFVPSKQFRLMKLSSMLFAAIAAISIQPLGKLPAGKQSNTNEFTPRCQRVYSLTYYKLYNKHLSLC